MRSLSRLVLHYANWLPEREPDLALNVFIVEMPSALAIDPQVVLETLDKARTRNLE